jgi:hypothetical protein
VPIDDVAWREAVGYLASTLVLAAFCVRDMLPLRILAIGSNLAFMTYGWAAGLRPVLLLHLVLLPTNLFRLWQLLRARAPDPRPDRSASLAASWSESNGGNVGGA